MNKSDSAKDRVVVVAPHKKKAQTRILYDACPLCTSKEIITLRSADCTKHKLYNNILDAAITWKRCSACSHVFTDGYFTDEASRIIFSSANEHQKVGNDIERQRSISAKMVEKVLPFVQSGYWLDIGFGNGSLLFTAQEYGFIPVGADLRDDNVLAIRNLGIEAHCQDIHKLEHPGRYSVISMADVLEHVPYPKDCLAAVHRLLEDGGIVLISMPNIDSMLWKELDKSNNNPYWGEIEHFHNFGKVRLYSLLDECGFEPLRYGISERYRICMEIIARKSGTSPKKKMPLDVPVGVTQVFSLPQQGNTAGIGQERQMVLNMNAKAPAKQVPVHNSKEAEAHFSQANAFKRLRQWTEAIESYDKAIVLDPKQPKFFLNKANTLRDMRRLNEALAVYDQAIAIKPEYADAYNNKGATLYDLRRSKEALACYDKAIACNPKSADALLNRGNVLRGLKRLEEALRDYDSVLSLKPDTDFLEGLRQHTRMHLCDWSDYPAATAALAEKVRRGKRACITFPLLALPSTPEEQLICAKVFTESQYPALPALWKGEVYNHNKIRIAYLSSDFYQHATAYLMAGLFEQHDKSKFEITALAFGTDDKSKMRQRLERSFDAFIDISGKSDEEAARLIREKEIDILVDLKGFTQNSRLGILARRPAPVQVNYLGYPGTTGAPYVDYIIADETVIPEKSKSAYSEKVVYLPDSYQPNDRNRVISTEVPSRASMGLPESGFIFCSFNGSFKITPDVFDIWMRLLESVEGSVLWLVEPSKAAMENLRKEASHRGVAPERIVFAPYVKLEDHLARHKQADLFLDTLPCNAHTTASDALWAGLPVLTCMGETFASRVAGSLLKVADMPELITHSLEEYESTALRLARAPEALAAIKRKLAKNRDTCALFDTERYTGHLEIAYKKMLELQYSGGGYESFGVDRIN